MTGIKTAMMIAADSDGCPLDNGVTVAKTIVSSAVDYGNCVFDEDIAADGIDDFLNTVLETTMAAGALFVLESTATLSSRSPVN